MTQEQEQFDPDLFDDRYKLAIVSSYSDIAGFTRDHLWRSSLQEREEAFARCLKAKHLRLMHLKHLERLRHPEDGSTNGLPPYSPTTATAFTEYVAANLTPSTTDNNNEGSPS